MENTNLFREENKDDGKGKYQSHECYIKVEFTSVQVNCNIDISIYGASEEEILENKLVTIDKLLTDLVRYRNELSECNCTVTNKGVLPIKYLSNIGVTDV